MRIYLAGGIFGLTDEQIHGWRDRAKELLKPHECLDPTDRDYRGTEDENVDDIVTRDKNDIELSHFVLVNISKPSWGTAMEILYAFEDLGVQVVCFGGGEKISPWITYHAHRVFATLEEACGYITDYVRSIPVTGKFEWAE